MSLRTALIRLPILCAILLLFTQAVAAAQQSYTAPARLTIPQGTAISVHLDEQLSSETNQPGDTFSASLAKPLVVHGIVVAQKGQVAIGRVVEAKKAGMVSGTSHLGVKLTSLTLVDGQPLPINAQLIVRRGAASVDRDVVAVASTTMAGTAIGSAVGWGKGAAIGAGVGAAAGTAGVLLTRGHPTVLYPESVLTFQTTTVTMVRTDEAPSAFRPVESADYPQVEFEQTQSPPQQAAAPVAQPAPPVVVYPYPYTYPYPVYWDPYYPYYPYYPYAYGPSVSFFFGNSHYYGYRHYAYPRYYPRHYPRYYSRGPYYPHASYYPRGHGAPPVYRQHPAPPYRGGPRHH